MAGENDYTTGTFQQITGRPPRPVAEFLHQYRAEFASADRGGRRQQPRHPMLVYETDSIRNMDELEHLGRYRPYLWKIWSWSATSTSAT